MLVAESGSAHRPEETHGAGAVDAVPLRPVRRARVKELANRMAVAEAISGMVKHRC